MKWVTLARMARRRSSEEIQQILEQFRASGLSQMEYCRQSGTVLSSLGRYLRRVKSPEQQLVRVKIESPRAMSSASVSSSIPSSVSLNSSIPGNLSTDVHSPAAICNRTEERQTMGFRRLLRLRQTMPGSILEGVNKN